MENKKESFLLYYSFWNSLSIMNDVQLGLLFRAIYHYVLDLEPIDLKSDGVVWMAFTFIRNQIKLDSQKYEEKCKLRAEAGVKSGIVRRQKKEQNEHVLYSTNKLNDTQQNEQMFDATEHNDNNGKEKEYVGDNDDDNVSLGVATSNKEFFKYYSIIFFRNITHPMDETKAFVDYYEDNKWTLSGGRELITLAERCKKAIKWTPHDPKNAAPRVEPAFLETWKKIWERMNTLSVSDIILHDSLNERISIRYSGQALDRLFIKAPRSVVNYLSATEEYNDILSEFRQIMNKIRTTRSIEFFALEDLAD